MASSKVMTRKSDLPTTPRSSSSSSSSLSSPTKSLDQTTTTTTTDSSLLLDAQITLIETPNPIPISKTVDEVWRQIVSGERKVCKQEQHDDEMMTLEDFLVKAGAVQDQDENEEDVKMKKEERLGGDSILAFPHNNNNNNNNNKNGSARVGKRPRVLEPLDKAAQQRQRRMIKNRESAARSRERKQAEKTKERFKQIMEKVIPVVENRRPPRVLRRVRSLQW
ncbi:hypothetical protein ACB098_01G165900 [Castanea mollissima]